MFSRKLTFLLFALVAGCVSENAQTERSCNTPNGTFGLCVPHNRCLYLKQQVEKFEDKVPREFVDYVNSSRCAGPNNREIFVCCEEEFIEDQTVQVTSPPLRQKPKQLVDFNGQQINEQGLQVLENIHCGENSSPRIANGNATNLNEFPFMALLKYNIAHIWGCGGALVTKRFVITAAHCWVGQQEMPYAVRLGEHDYSKDEDCEKRHRMLVCNPPPVDYDIEKLIAHPSYKQTDIHHDIGLILLDREVTFDVHIQPICLPIYPESLEQDDPRYIIAGWGTTEKDTLSSLLLKAVIPAREISYCQNHFRSYSITDDDQICAGGGSNSITCQGDSGGPLFYQAPYKKIPRNVQFGIVSIGYISCGSTYPAVYTKITPYLPWITDTIAQNDV